jgi:hypothetical protein
MAWTIGVLSAPKQFHYPIALYMVPLVVFFGCKALLGPLLYLRRVRCSAGEIAGAALAGMGLSHAIAQGVFAGLAQREGVFEITRKGSRVKAGIGLAAAREEGLLLFGLAMCIVGVALTRMPGHLESALWLGVLSLQAVPYAAALACAWLSTWTERPVVAPAATGVSPEPAPVRPVGTLGTVGPVAAALQQLDGAATQSALVHTEPKVAQFGGR